jgi:predicted phage terminase large subunit-like protein
MGFMPPGAGKSIFTSVVFPTHFLGRFPKTQVILACYDSELPRKMGRRARSIITQAKYKRIMGCSISAESAAADEWALTNGSEWMAKGLTTGISGNRANGVIWDDPIKNREAADSDVIRNKTWQEYQDALLTRKKPNAWEVGISTRWHEDDLPGRILPLNYNGESGWIKCRDGNDWYVVCLPAECEREDDILKRKIGEILWPEWFTPEFFNSFKRQTRTWNALYQQRPAPETGDFFQADWLKPYQKAPDRRTLNIYGASDYAVSQDEGNYTVHVVVGVDPAGRVYLLDLWRKQASPDKWVEAFCDMVEFWKPIGWAEESGQIKASVGPFLEKRLRERQLYIARAKFPTKGDKSVRAQSIRGRMAMDGLYVPIHAPWFPELKRELMTFPAARNDDMVDALGLVGQILDKMISGSKLDDSADKPKVLSTDPNYCTVTLNDLFEANEERKAISNLRIH